MKLTHFTSGASPSRRTTARESTDAVHARAAAQARLRRTLVHVDPTVGPREALGAQTPKPTGTRFARTAIVTRLPLTLVHGLGTKRTTPTQRASTLRHAQRDVRQTGAAVQTLSGQALGHAFRTGFAYKL